MATDYRRANYIPLVTNGKLDLLRTKYRNLKFLVPVFTTFNVTQEWEANLPGIAFNLYRTVDFWWVIAEYNGIVDPILDVYTGRILQIPRFDDVVALLNDATVNTTPNQSTNLVII